MDVSPEGHAWRPDLIVHDGAQAHDADVDVIFLADQPGVLQGSPARQRVTTTADDKKAKTNGVKFFLKWTRENLSAGSSRPDKSENKTPLVTEPLSHATLTQGGC